MAYTVKPDGGGLVSGLASGTSCVFLAGGVPALIGSAARGGYIYATASGGLFTFFAQGAHGPEPIGDPVGLPTATLNSACAGGRVLVDVGGGIYKSATVASDGTSSASSSGTLDASTPAYTPATGQQFPTSARVGATVSKVGTAADGTTWFTVAGVQVACSASNVGAQAGHLVVVGTELVQL
jgi:hypothetical protein